ncbi:family 1 glycosylhydrolase [Paenibacillus albidus]|uniref:family 1 glycosylhydrolase n=1 Tax=Paenibacillus albidus TaxID=2041023 RepID=UPI0020355D01|nr:family 1 glycosylhydrolase [Paenibacillus albidus]
MEQMSEKNGEVQVGLNMDMKSRMENYNRSLSEAFEMDSRHIHSFLAARTDDGDILIMRCHERARQVIKEVKPNIKIGITFSIFDHQALPGGEEHVEKEQDEDFLHYLPYIQEDDFLGVQNYSRKIYGPNGVVSVDDNTRVTKAGYEYYPEALVGVLRFASKHWSKPMFVTENGVSTDNDEERVEFIKRALSGVHQCVEDGIHVIGYMYWSLLDNFEWQLGYDQTFGLIGVDRATQTRYPKESLSYLGQVKKYGINT